MTTDSLVDPNVLPHPQDSQRALSYKHNLECIKGGQHHCFGSLLLTSDGGSSWQEVSKRVKYPNYAWSQSGSAILAVLHPKVDRKSKSTRWDPGLQLVRTTDNFKNFKVCVVHV